MKKCLLGSFLILLIAGYTDLAAQTYSKSTKLNVLFFVSDSASTVSADSMKQPGDKAVYFKLKEDANIASVTVKTKKSLTAADKDAYDVILLSATIGSTDAAPLKDASAGIVCWESFAFRPTGLGVLPEPTYKNYNPAKDPGDDKKKYIAFNKIKITSDKDLLNAGIPLGDVIVYDDQTIDPPTQGNSGVYYIKRGVVDSTKGFIIAHHLSNSFTDFGNTQISLGGDTVVAIWGLEMGAKICATASSDKVARNSTNRQIGFFWHDVTARTASDDAWKLFKASVYWAGHALSNGFGSIKADYFRVFPNPATDRIYLELPTGRYDLSIYDLTGKEILRQNQIVARSQFDISNLHQGIYLVKATNGQKVYSSKISVK